MPDQALVSVRHRWLRQFCKRLSILKEGRVVFNIAGNKYRLVTSINYPYGIVFVRFIGTHKQYDAIDAQTI
ncbi:MAG: type II toxin-antitoxin system HigB family toxin [Telluria sp.]|nr:type II toxin-antitoxin system HigB family toxin [Telluria sp.]